MWSTYRKDTIQAVKQAIRHPYTDHGGYPVYVLLNDGSYLCPSCARSEFRLIVHATRYECIGRNDWAANGVDILWETEGSPEHCGHCGKELQSAYGVV